MITHSYLENGIAILKSRLATPAPAGYPAASSVRPFVTLSRESCSGATTLGRMLIPRLDAEFGEEGQGWMLLDRELLNFALEHHDLPESLARYLPEDKISEIDALIGEMVGLHPSIWALEHQVAESIVQLAHVGRVVFVGRAAHLLTRALPGGFHVRLVAARETRVRRLMESQGVAAREAGAEVDRTDHGRTRFVRSHFGQDIGDPHAYDIVINTGRISPGTAATLVIEGLRHQMATEHRFAPLWAHHASVAEAEGDPWSLRD
jgi:cytidylate kinase